MCGDFFAFASVLPLAPRCQIGQYPSARGDSAVLAREDSKSARTRACIGLTCRRDCQCNRAIRLQSSTTDSIVRLEQLFAREHSAWWLKLFTERPQHRVQP